MTLLHCQCGSTRWIIVAQFTCGFTVPTLSVKSYLAMSVEHPEHEPKCAECGAPQPSHDELMARKSFDPKRHPGLPEKSHQ